jgi:predicted RNase H-like nuclease (RuvC/YqgF family)
MADNTLDTVITVGMLFLLVGALNKKPEPPPTPPCTVTKDVLDAAQKSVDTALKQVTDGLDKRFDAVESGLKLASKLPPVEKEAIQVVEDLKNKASDLDKKAAEVDKQKEDLKKKIADASDNSKVLKMKDKELEDNKKELEDKQAELAAKTKAIEDAKKELDKLGKECKTPNSGTSFELPKSPVLNKENKIASNSVPNGVIHKKSTSSKIVTDSELRLDKCCTPDEI